MARLDLSGLRHRVASDAVSSRDDQKKKEEFRRKVIQFRKDLFEGGIGFCRRVLNESPEWANIETDAQGSRPLHDVTLSTNGTPAMIDLLLEHGADIEARNKDGLTPLGFAVTRNNFDVCARHLMARGASIWAKEEHDASACSLLHLAARSPRSDLVALFCELGGSALIENKGPEGARALHLAAEQGLQSNMAILLRAGADPNAERDDGCCPVRLVLAQPLEFIIHRPGHRNTEQFAPLLTLIAHGASMIHVPESFSHFTMAMAAARLGDVHRLSEIRRLREESDAPLTEQEMQDANRVAKEADRSESSALLESWMAMGAIEKSMKGLPTGTSP